MTRNRKRNLRRRLFEAQSGCCALCGGEMQAADLLAADGATFDHIVPISRGGSYSAVANLQLAHRVCNMLRGNGPLTTIQPLQKQVA